MTDKPTTSDVNAKLWGARAQDWADFQEVQHRLACEAIMAKFAASGTSVLDVGCGAGMATRIAADCGAQVSGIDASADMIAIARSRVPEGDFRVGDLETLPFADAAFDLVTGFNAFQYAGNPAKALRDARRTAKPDGHVVVMTWGPPEGMPAAAIVGALRALLPPPPPGAPGPFALSDETALRALAHEAGLSPVEIIDVDSPFQYRNLETALRALGSSGVAVRAVEQAGEDAVNDAHAKALAPFQLGDGSYRVGAVFRCLIARP